MMRSSRLGGGCLAAIENLPRHNLLTTTVVLNFIKVNIIPIIGRAWVSQTGPPLADLFAQLHFFQPIPTEI